MPKQETMDVDQFRKAMGLPVKHSDNAAKKRPQPTPGKMNKTESLYAYELELRQKAGEVKWWRFEAFKLRLADRTTYSPDFVVQLADGTIELVEVKGYWQDDAKVKFKVARELFPMFRFVAICRTKSGWESAI